MHNLAPFSPLTPAPSPLRGEGAALSPLSNPIKASRRPQRVAHDRFPRHVRRRQVRDHGPFPAVHSIPPFNDVRFTLAGGEAQTELVLRDLSPADARGLRHFKLYFEHWSADDALGAG